MAPGEMGVEVVVPQHMKANVSAVLDTYRINVLASDVIPLNRLVPDSRFPGYCCVVVVVVLSVAPLPKVQRFVFRPETITRFKVSLRDCIFKLFVVRKPRNPTEVSENKSPDGICGYFTN